MHYYQHHITNFLAKTHRLTDRQKIVYLYLMWDYLHKESSLPDDMDALSKITGYSSKDISPVLELMFVKAGDFWMEMDLENQLADYRRHQESSRKGGIASGQSRAKKPVVGGFFEGPRRRNERPLNTPSSTVEVPLNTPSTPLEANRSIQLDQIPY